MNRNRKTWHSLTTQIHSTENKNSTSKPNKIKESIKTNMTLLKIIACFYIFGQRETCCCSLSQVTVAADLQFIYWTVFQKKKYILTGWHKTIFHSPFYKEMFYYGDFKLGPKRGLQKNIQ